MFLCLHIDCFNNYIKCFIYLYMFCEIWSNRQWNVILVIIYLHISLFFWRSIVTCWQLTFKFSIFELIGIVLACLQGMVCEGLQGRVAGWLVAAAQVVDVWLLCMLPQALWITCFLVDYVVIGGQPLCATPEVLYCGAGTLALSLLPSTLVRGILGHQFVHQCTVQFAKTLRGQIKVLGTDLGKRDLPGSESHLLFVHETSSLSGFFST